MGTRTLEGGTTRQVLQLLEQHWRQRRMEHVTELFPSASPSSSNGVSHKLKPEAKGGWKRGALRWRAGQGRAGKSTDWQETGTFNKVYKTEIV